MPLPPAQPTTKPASDNATVLKSNWRGATQCPLRVGARGDYRIENENYDPDENQVVRWRNDPGKAALRACLRDLTKCGEVRRYEFNPRLTPPPKPSKPPTPI
jgi:hypothetical protein